MLTLQSKIFHFSVYSVVNVFLYLIISAIIIIITISAISSSWSSSSVKSSVPSSVASIFAVVVSRLRCATGQFSSHIDVESQQITHSTCRYGLYISRVQHEGPRSPGRWWFSRGENSKMTVDFVDVEFLFGSLNTSVFLAS